MSIGFPTAPLAFRLRGAGGSAVENPQPVQRFHYPARKPVQLIPTTALRALAYLARSLDVQVPVLDGTLASNLAHKQRALAMVTAIGKKRVGVLGLSFKDGTDDLRESPTVELVEQLIGKGFSVRIFDPHVSVSRLTGANKAYIDRELPHVASLLVEDLSALVLQSDIIVATKRAPQYADALKLLRDDQTIVDLVRLFRDEPTLGNRYDALVG